MKARVFSIALAVGLLQAPSVLHAQAGAAAQASPWFGRIAALGAFYHSSATIATSGILLQGATATVSNNQTLTFDIGYDFTRNLFAMLMVGVPPKPTVTGEGTVTSLGALGRVRYGPAILTGGYRIGTGAGLRPYVGAGAAYAIIVKDHDAAVSQLDVHNNWGFVLQAGAEYSLNKALDLFADFKQLWLAVDANGLLSGGVPVKARVTLNPSLVSAGVKFRFH
ncbi:MAG TPA: OmpW family outer membrane protein [Gemmatimonadales bacterium]|jgi:outer membrane protein|nr:OmpW family outer membrane protein [Gemmatimonadales bacterium]